MALVLSWYGWKLRNAASVLVATVIMAGAMTAVSWRAYEGVRVWVPGLDYLTLGLVLLVVAQAISAAKAGLLTRLAPIEDEPVETFV